MDKYAQSNFNIWRFFLDNENRDVCNSILGYLGIGDYYNFWASIFGWIPFDIVCRMCFEDQWKNTCYLCGAYICHGCRYNSRVFNMTEYCVRCSNIQSALIADEWSFTHKRLKFEKSPTGYSLSRRDTKHCIQDHTQQKRGPKKDNIE